MRRSQRFRLLALATGLLGVLAVAVFSAPGLSQAAARAAAPLAGIHPDIAGSLAGFVVSAPVPNAFQSYDSAGGTVNVTSGGVGRYTVAFPGLAGIVGGDVQVSPSGTAELITCAVKNWLPVSTRLDVNVRCFNYLGRPANARFALTVTQPAGTLKGVLDYALVAFPNSSYVLAGPHARAADRKFQFNSAGGKNSVKHLRTGQYLVRMAGKGQRTGTIKVSPFGASPGDCSLAKWTSSSAGQQIYVDCFSASGGRQNRAFVVAYASGGNLLARSDLVTANAAATGSGAVYRPAVQYDSVKNARVTVAHLSTGRYEVFPAGSEGGFNNANGGGGDIQVSPVSSVAVHCDADAFSGLTDEILINCFNPAGRPVNAKFMIQWVVVP